MIRIFDAKPVSPRFKGLGKMVGLNLAVASVSAVPGFSEQISQPLIQLSQYLQV
jgi:hypothetical protein